MLSTTHSQEGSGGSTSQETGFATHLMPHMAAGNAQVTSNVISTEVAYVGSGCWNQTMQESTRP